MTSDRDAQLSSLHSNSEIPKDSFSNVLTGLFGASVQQIAKEQLIHYVVEAAESMMQSYNATACEWLPNEEPLCLYRTSAKGIWDDKHEANICFFAVKGTSTINEWLEYDFDASDFQAVAVSALKSIDKSGKKEFFPHAIQVHKGFVNYAQRIQADRRYIEFLNSKECDARLLVGHSLGAAAAHLLSAMAASSDILSGVYLFGLPNIMQSSVSETYLPLTLSVVHSGDIVTSSPPYLTHIYSPQYLEHDDAFYVKARFSFLVVMLLYSFFLYQLRQFISLTLTICVWVFLLTAVLFLFLHFDVTSYVLPHIKTSPTLNLFFYRQEEVLLENHNKEQYLYSSLRLRLCGNRFNERAKDYLRGKYRLIFDTLLKTNPEITRRDIAGPNLNNFFIMGTKCN
jgi:hypothetical protein